MVPWRARWAKILIDPIYMGVLASMNVAFSLILCVVDRTTSTVENFFTIVAVVAVILNLVFVVDLIVNFVVLGASTIWKEKKYLYYELLLQVFSIAYFVVIITETY